MRILHTSDWHLGRSLYGRKRYEEFAAFLAWLEELLEKEHIDILLVAGDIFDTTTPSNRAQELYYHFLHRVAESSCHYVVITAGNHDSPSFLNAPRDLLRHLQVYVVGSVGTSPAEEVLLLKDPEGEPQLIVAAVPYLRDRDIRRVEPGESPADKDRKLVEGIKEHYALVGKRAQEVLDSLEHPVPAIVMGHLFAAGGYTMEGDGVRELYVGSLVHVGADVFPHQFDYAALGHLHTGQTVAGKKEYRYAGAPLPMGFGEGGRAKQVIMIEFTDDEMNISPLAVPLFQVLATIQGDWQQICCQLEELAAAHPQAWVEIVYNGAEIISDLRERLDELTEGSQIEILRIKNDRLWEKEMTLLDTGEVLNELDVTEVFSRCLEDYQLEADQRNDLLQLYKEVLDSLYLDELAE